MIGVLKADAVGETSVREARFAGNRPLGLPARMAIAEGTPWDNPDSCDGRALSRRSDVFIAQG